MYSSSSTSPKGSRRAALMNTLTDMLDGLVSSVSIDAQLIRPAAGKVAVFIEPPTVEWPSWGPPEPVWTLDVIAGTPATQPSAVDDILAALDRLDLKDGEPQIERDEYGKIGAVRVSAINGQGLDLLRAALVEAMPAPGYTRTKNESE